MTGARLALAALLCVAAASPMAAQSTSLVPLDDPAYLWLDRLEVLGLVDSAVMGQRPYSYREMQRLAHAARGRSATRTDDADYRLTTALLDRLDARITGQPAATPIADALFAATGTDAVRRPLPGAGTSSPPEAEANPLIPRRLGPQPVRGQTAALEPLQRIEPTSWLAFQARERLEVRHATAGSRSSWDTALLVASGRARWRNVALGVGRQQVGWGSGGEGGLIIASDAPALDQISLGSDAPFLLPSVLRRLGPVAATLLVADMGPSSVRSESELLAYKVSARPSAALELGFSFEDHYGGVGGRPSSFLDRLVDFLPVVDVFRKHNYTDTTRTLDVDSDKVLGTDVRWRIDRLGGVIVAGEWLLDDFDVGRLASVFNYGASQRLVVTVPRVGSPAWSVQVGAAHLGPLTYTHFTIKPGMTTRGRLLGSELGPDSKAFSAGVTWMASPDLRLSVDGMASIHSDVSYSDGYDAEGNWVVRKVSARPDELREQAVGSLTFAPTADASLTLRAGAARIRNAMFTGGRRHDWVADVGFRVRP